MLTYQHAFTTFTHLKSPHQKSKPMKICGFSMVKNATKLYYPMKEAIASILPIVDEFVVALGDCDEDDQTRDEILSLQSPKVRIIDTVWDLDAYPNGMENAHQTDIAKDACSGDWLFYLQADEVVHEKYLPTIRNACQKYLDDYQVEGILFKYKHFWGDYHHYHQSHNWYPNEIRIIRNDPDIHSWKSAQSFRRIPNFDGKSYRQKENTFKLKVAAIDAYIYHYGWVRPPYLMRKKNKALDTIHKGEKKASEIYESQTPEFDYGPLGKIAEYKESHPAVMKDFIKRFDWADKLNYGKKYAPNTPIHKHDQPKYRLLSFIENQILGGRQIGGTRNYQIARNDR